VAEQKKQTAAESEEPKAEKVTYAQERLIEEAGPLLDQPSHVVAGALSGVEKKNLSKDEAAKHVRDFLKREVEVDAR
jgi:hypothetical protein